MTKAISLSPIIPKKLANDAIKALVFGRIIKYLANCLRPIFYIDFFFRPHKRYHIASRTSQFQYSHDHGPIPRIVWQTNYTNKVTLPILTTIKFNQILSQGYEYMYVSTLDRKLFIQEHFPGETFDLYSRLNIGAAQADLWRLLVLYKFGGVYMDIDSYLVWPLEKLLSGNTNELFLRYKCGRFTNYFIAAAPKSKVLKALIKEVISRIKSHSSNSVYHITGPDIFDSLLPALPISWRETNTTCKQGDFSNKFFQYIDHNAGHYSKEESQIKVVSG